MKMAAPHSARCASMQMQTQPHLCNATLACIAGPWQGCAAKDGRAPPDTAPRRPCHGACACGARTHWSGTFSALAAKAKMALPKRSMPAARRDQVSRWGPRGVHAWVDGWWMGSTSYESVALPFPAVLLRAPLSKGSSERSRGLRPTHSLSHTLTRSTERIAPSPLMPGRHAAAGRCTPP